MRSSLGWRSPHQVRQHHARRAGCRDRRQGLELAGADLDAVADATATRALPAHDGGTPIPAEIVHRTALAELADRFAAVVKAGDIAA
jgi:hypothetical protein